MPDGKPCTSVLNNLGTLYLDTNQYSKGERVRVGLIRRSLKIRPSYATLPSEDTREINVRTRGAPPGLQILLQAD